MGKILGAALVLAACVGYAGSLTEKQKSHRDILCSLIQMIGLLAEEIRYERLPMAEAFAKLHRKYHGAVGQILRQMVQQLSGTEYADLESVWESCFRDNKRELMLTTEELDIVLEVGKNLGYLDAGAQVNHLRASGRRLEQKLDEVQRELEQKQRIYRTLAVAAGAIVILVLL